MIKNVCSLQASTLNVCASIVLSKRIFKVKYSHQSKTAITKIKIKNYLYFLIYKIYIYYMQKQKAGKTKNAQGK